MNLVGFFTGKVGTADNDILIDMDEASLYDTFMLQHTAGAVDVFVSLDGTHFTTDPQSLVDFGAVTSDPVVVTAPNRMFGFRGKFRKIRVQQNGGTNVTGLTMSYGTMGG